MRLRHNHNGASMTNGKAQHPSFRITIEAEGVVHHGSYQRLKHSVRITSEYGTKVIDTPNGNEEVWAKQGLRELVREEKLRSAKTR